MESDPVQELLTVLRLRQQDDGALSDQLRKQLTDALTSLVQTLAEELEGASVTFTSGNARNQHGAIVKVSDYNFKLNTQKIELSLRCQEVKAPRVQVAAARPTLV